MLGSERNLKMYVQNLGYPVPLQIGAQNHFLWTTSQLNGNLTAYIIGTKHDVHKRASALQTTSGSPTSSQNDMNFSPKRLQIGSEFSPTLRKFCIPLHCQASQTELNQTLPNGGGSVALTIYRRDIWVVPS